MPPKNLKIVVAPWAQPMVTVVDTTIPGFSGKLLENLDGAELSLSQAQDLVGAFRAKGFIVQEKPRGRFTIESNESQSKGIVIETRKSFIEEGPFAWFYNEDYVDEANANNVLSLNDSFL